MDVSRERHNHGVQSGIKVTEHVRKALILLICGVLILFILECTHMTRSSSCYPQDGYYKFFARKPKETIKPPRNNGLKKKTLPFVQPHTDVLTTSPNPVTEYENNDNVNVLDIQIDRQLRLRNFCHYKQASLKSINNRNLKNLFYSDLKQVLYCSVPKVACTNWKRLFQVFEGNIKQALDIKEKQKVHLLKYSTFATINNTEIQRRKNLYYSFLFVRHPLERLLSAYRNKLLDPYNTVFQRQIGSKILRLYRPRLTRKQYNEGKNVTFKEFVDYVIKTFDENGSDGLDEHWRNIHSLCSPCSMKYNYIGKMETLVSDAEQVLKEIGLDKQVKFPSKATDKYQVKVDKLMRKYYLTIPSKSVNKLYEIYEDDFVSFGYDLPEYL